MPLHRVAFTPCKHLTLSRFRACQEVGVTPEFIEYEGDDPLGYVISLKRQREHGGTAPGTNKNTGGNNSTSDSGKSRDKVAKDFNSNGRYVSDMKKIQRRLRTLSTENKSFPETI